MQKAKIITYWVATLWLALGLVATGIVQLMHQKEGVGGAVMMQELGYPAYLMTLLGVLKILAAAIILLPHLVLPKQWAYAGIFFLTLGAIYSHIAISGVSAAILPALLIGILALGSWYLLPKERKIPSNIIIRKV